MDRQTNKQHPSSGANGYQDFYGLYHFNEPIKFVSDTYAFLINIDFKSLTSQFLTLSLENVSTESIFCLCQPYVPGRESLYISVLLEMVTAEIIWLSEQEESVEMS